MRATAAVEKLDLFPDEMVIVMFSFLCFAPVKRLAEKLVSKLTSNVLMQQLCVLSSPKRSAVG